MADRLTLITTAAGDFVIDGSPDLVAETIRVAEDQGQPYVELAQPRLAWQTADDDAERILVRADNVIAIRPAPPIGRVAPASALGGDFIRRDG